MKLSHLRSSTLVCVLLVCALAAGAAPRSALAQTPEGSVTFTGPGVSLVPSSTFVPATYIGDGQGSWSFFDASETVGLVVVEDELDPTRAAFLTIAVEGGATWFLIGLFDPIPGVAIAGDTISFTNVVVPEQTPSSPQNLTLNGTLTRPTTVGTADRSFGEIKDEFGTRR